MSDGIYYLHPEGSAWIGVSVVNGAVKDQWYEANAGTHAAAHDQYAGLVPQDGDIQVDDDDAAEIVAAAMGDDTCADMVVVTRPAPVYTLEMRDGQCTETHNFGTNRPTKSDIRKAIDEWVNGGEWGSDGARIDVCWSLQDDGNEIDDGYHTTEIEPDHESLIAAACGGKWDDRRERCCGPDPDDHDWTSEGEGGCTENPGVWSTGGTSMSFASHCRTCGLHRREHHTGSQRNPGEHDTVKYEMPESWCEECQSEECACEHVDAE